MIEDSCDALGTDAARHAHRHPLRHLRHVSFALSHIITAAGTGGMVLPRRRRPGRPLPAPAPVGSPLGGAVLRLQEGSDTRFFSSMIDGIEYDNLFIFDEVGWNFEPSELSRRVRRWCSCEKLPSNLARAQAQLRLARRRSSASDPTCSSCPARLEGSRPAWHMFPVLIRPESGIRRSEFQEHMEGNGIDTRMVWTGQRHPPAGVRQGAAPCSSRRASRTPTG